MISKVPRLAKQLRAPIHANAAIAFMSQLAGKKKVGWRDKKTVASPPDDALGSPAPQEAEGSQSVETLPAVACEDAGAPSSEAERARSEGDRTVELSLRGDVPPQSKPRSDIIADAVRTEGRCVEAEMSSRECSQADALADLSLPGQRGMSPGVCCLEELAGASAAAQPPVQPVRSVLSGSVAGLVRRPEGALDAADRACQVEMNRAPSPRVRTAEVQRQLGDLLRRIEGMRISLPARNMGWTPASRPARSGGYAYSSTPFTALQSRSETPDSADLAAVSGQLFAIVSQHVPWLVTEVRSILPIYLQSAIWAHPVHAHLLPVRLRNRYASWITCSSSLPKR
jgi:hypothetical protein